MFTLKLYRRVNGQLTTKTLEVHHVQTMEIGENGRLLELWAFSTDFLSEIYFIGEKEVGMTAINEDNLFGWGLLENNAGKTTEHYRPANFG